jgi:putative endonuclease
MRNAQVLLGQYGESRAAQFLESLGWQIIERNWRCSLGEIDLVAARENRISIVEVKTRRGHGHGHPFEAITKAKASRLRLLAVRWCRERGENPADLSIDAIAVSLIDGSVTLEHLERVA